RVSQLVAEGKGECVCVLIRRQSRELCSRAESESRLGTAPADHVADGIDEVAEHKEASHHGHAREPGHLRALSSGRAILDRAIEEIRDIVGTERTISTVGPDREDQAATLVLSK